MQDEEIRRLIREGEGTTIDYKRDQYIMARSEKSRGDVGKDEKDFNYKKSEFLKDILAMVNAWRKSDSYILIGFKEIRGHDPQLVGVERDSIHDESTLQAIISSYVSKQIVFEYKPVEYQGKTIVVLLIPLEQPANRPFFSTRNYGHVSKNVVYVRRGSITHQADPDEIVEMAAKREAIIRPRTAVRLHLLDEQGAPTELLAINPVHPRFIVEGALPRFEDRERGWLKSFWKGKANPEYWRQLATWFPTSERIRWFDFEVTNESQITLNDCSIEISLEDQDGREVSAHVASPSWPRRYGNMVAFEKEYDDFKRGKLDRHKVKNLWFESLRPGERKRSPESLRPFFGGCSSLVVRYKVIARELPDPFVGSLGIEIHDVAEEWDFERLKKHDDDLRARRNIMFDD